MKMLTLNYTVNGETAGGNTYEITGSVKCRPGDFPLGVDACLDEAFMKLTQGKAVFGHPGKGSCQGPYSVTRLLIELPPQPREDTL